MATYPKKLTWNPTQLAILEALKTGASQHEIAKDLHVNIAVVAKVNHAYKKGQSPSDPFVPRAKKTTPSPTTKAPNVFPQEDIPVVSQQSRLAGNATVLKLKPVSVEGTLTPVMCNVKAYLVQRLGWSPDTPWEEIIDAIFTKYFQSIGVVMRAWYEVDEFGPPKPAPENGNGHKQAAVEQVSINTESDAYKRLADRVTMQIIQLAQQGKLAG